MNSKNERRRCKVDDVKSYIDCCVLYCRNVILMRRVDVGGQWWGRVWMGEGGGGGSQKLPWHLALTV